jgi:hypothetical protein
MADTDAPLSEAELDLLASLDAARTPGPLIAVAPYSTEGGQGIAHTGSAGSRSWDRSRATSIRSTLPTAEPYRPTTPEQAEADARAIAAALNALGPLLAEVRASRLAAVEVASIAAVLQAQGPCLACRVEGEEETCACHESRELGAVLVTVMGAKGAGK